MRTRNIGNKIVKLTQEKDRLAKNYAELERNAAEEIRAKDEELKRTMRDLKYLKQRNSESVAEEIKLQADNKILRGTIKELHDSIKRISMGARDAVEAATEQRCGNGSRNPEPKEKLYNGKAV